MILACLEGQETSHEYVVAGMDMKWLEWICSGWNGYVVA